ncbi:MAG: hypothetical protein K4571_03005 [Deltaproteobacteria bacterium]
MTEETKQSDPVQGVHEKEEEIDLLERAVMIWNHKKLIMGIVAGFTLVVILLTLLMQNIYTAGAVLKPASQIAGAGKLASLAGQFSGIANITGIAMPNPTSSAEIVSLLKSNVLRAKMIEQYQLLPVIFQNDWDAEKKRWKEPTLKQIILDWIRPSYPGVPEREPGFHYVWDGIRELEDMVKVDYNMKDDLVTITVEATNPQTAAKIANYFITTLNEHMSSDAKRIALINKEYLEKQLLETKDPIVQQKIYSLIAEKIETMMMAEVKEGFAFKVLDPPMAPDKKTKPKRPIIVIVGFMFSCCLAVAVVFYKASLLNIIKRFTGGRHAK